MIDNVSHEFDNGRVTAEHVEAMLALVYPDDEQERGQRRERVMPGGNIIKFQLVALNKQAAQAIRDGHKNPPVAAEPELPAEFLLDVPEEVQELRGPDYVPEIKSKLGMIAAVRMFGKPQGTIRENRTEGIKVRCPFPFHEDNRPSAWVNTEKNTWFCGKCQTGGDVIDFYAAAKHSLEPDQFHRSPEFRTITEEMAEVLGIEGYLPPDTSAWASPVPDATEEQATLETPQPLDPDYFPIMEEGRESDPPVPKPIVPPSSEADEPITVTTDELLRGISFESEPDDEEPPDLFHIDPPSYDVDRLQLRDDSFLYSWMAQHQEELPWVPPEYVMMLGLQAIGLASGHNLVSHSQGRPLTGALMMVLIGPSAYGKSTAADRLKNMLRNVPGPRFDDSLGSGVKMLPSLSSPEALVAYMRTNIEDPNDATQTLEVPTTALLFEDEFAVFIERTRRRGGGHLKQRLMQFYDFTKQRADPELVLEDFSLSGGKRSVHDSYLSALFLTQTQSIRMLAERIDLVSGFLNRIIPVFGVQRVPEQYGAERYIDPTPPYFNLYEDLWRKCRDSTIAHPDIMHFDAGARQMANDHPFFTVARKLANESSIYARLPHVTFRLAFLLAVNDNVPTAIDKGESLKKFYIDEHHLGRAVDLVHKFIKPGYDALVEAVSVDEVDELGQEIIKFLEAHFARKNRWPEVREVMGRAFWKKYSSTIRPKALDQLRFTKQLTEVRLQSSTSRTTEIMIATRGPWASYSAHAGKTFKSKDFYAHIDNG